MRELPPGWAIATFSEITNYISRGKSPKYAAKSTLPVINQKAIRWFGIQEEHLKFVHEDQVEHWELERYISSGDILWNSTGTGTVGRACLVQPEHLSPPKVVDSHVTVVRPDRQVVDPRYLFAWIRGPEVQGLIEDLATGTTNQIELNRSTITAIQIPIAPANEQKRIVDKLDVLLARVDACRKHLNLIPAILKGFRQSLLAAATSGKLTGDWREKHSLPPGYAKRELQILNEARKSSNSYKYKEPIQPDLSYWTLQLPQSWEVGSVSNFAECLDYKRIPVKKDDRNNSKGVYPYYGANGLVDMVDEFIFDDELVLVTEDETFYGREKPIAYRSSGKCWVNNHAHVLRTCNIDSADYLCYCLMYYNVIPWLTGTTGRAKLTQAVLNALPIAIPPQQEVSEIVRRVKTLLAYADQVEAHYNLATTKVEGLTPSLLAKAFRGELVTQDPDDEPASMLLERIRTARAKAPERARIKKRTGRPKTIQKTEVIMLQRHEVPLTHLTNILRERGPLTPEALWTASQLAIDDFYDQLKSEEELGLLQEQRSDAVEAPRLLEIAA